jgi:8-hydroxy-5-deazaflavin:NADPH oxidoreductase
MKVAIVGGTGPFGRGVAARLAAAGDEVVVGSRDADRAAAVAGALGVRGARNEDAVEGVELVVLAVDAQAALETATALSRFVGATPLLSVASELRFRDRRALPADEPTSLAERIAAAVDAPVAAGLHSLAAGKLAHERPAEDALVCGDDEHAKELALELAGHVVAGRAIDVGPLAVARGLEAMTAVIVNVNRRYKGHAGIRLTGLP